MKKPALLTLLLSGLLLCSVALADNDKPEAPPKKKATKADYKLTAAAAHPRLKLGASDTLQISIQAKNGTRLHPDAPLVGRLQWPAGLVGEKDKLSHADAVRSSPTALTLQTGFQTSALGSHTINVEVSFFLCVDTWCQRMRETVSVRVDVDE